MSTQLESVEPPNSQYPDGEIDLATIVRVIGANRILVFGCAFLFAAVTAVIVLLMPNTYRGEVVVTEAEDRTMGTAGTIANQLGGLASLAGVNIQANSQGHEALAVLKSRHLIEEFITRNNLVSTLMEKEAERRKTLWWATKKFHDDVMTIKEDTRGGTISVTVDWTDPKIASDWANQIVALTNEVMRTRAMDEATRSLTYLKKQLEQTDVVALRESVYHLIEAQTKTLMLTNARPEYSFKIVDPAIVPELKVSPRRALWVIAAFLFGFLVGSITAFVRRSMRRSRQTVVS